MQTLRKIWAWVQKNATTVAVLSASVVAFLFASRASLYRRKQVKELEKSRKLQREDVQAAEVHKAKAKAAAATADAILESGKHTITRMTNEPETATDERVDRINKRLRDAARAHDRSG